MASFDAGSAIYTLDADDSNFLKTVNNAKKGNQTMQSEFDKTDKKASGLTTQFKKLGVAIAGALSVNAVKNYVLQLSAAVDEQAKFADRIGVTYEELQKLEFVASQTGVSVNSLRTGLQRMTRRVSEAAQGTGAAKDALIELGLEAKNLNQLAPEEQFKAIADAFEDIEAQSDRVRLAMRLFDTEGVALINTMKGGTEAIEELGESTVVISRNAARQFEWLNDQIDLFATNTKGTLGNWTAEVIRLFRKLFGDEFSPVEEVENQLIDIENAIQASSQRIAILSAQQRVLPETIYQKRENTQAFKSLQSQIDREEAAIEAAIKRRAELQEELTNFEVVRGEAGTQPLLEGLGGGMGGEAMQEAGKNAGANFIRGFGAALDSEDGFATGISAGIIGDSETLLEQLERQRQLILEFQELGIGDAEKHAEALIAIDKRQNMERMRLQSMMLAATSDFFDGSAELIGAFAGESSNAYKALFAVSKGFAIANAALQLQTAIANASALPFPANIPAIANAVALGGQIASNISSLTYAGGRAGGGGVESNRLYEVGENNNPEIFSSGGRQFMIPGNRGEVFNQSQLGSTGGNTTYSPQTNITVQGDADMGKLKRMLDKRDAENERKFADSMRNKNGVYYNSITNNTTATARVR